MKLLSCLEVAGIKPEEIAKWKADGFGHATNVRPEDKTGGGAAAQSGNIITRWLDVTPDMARRWLQANFINRDLKEDVVQSYARQIMTGDFIPTHQGIAFNDADELIDGQHFLNAVVRTGRTVRRLVTFGLPKTIPGKNYTVMDVIDSGKARSIADQLKIQHGLKNGSQIAQICSALAHLCVGERMRRLSVGQTLDIYRAFKDGVDYVIEHRSKQSGLKSAGVLGAFAFVMSAEDCMIDYAGQCQAIFNLLNSGEFTAKNSSLKSVKLLREFLTGENATLILASMNRGIAELCVWSVWADFKTQPVEKLATEPADWFKAVDHFRNLQRARVDKLAGVFKLPAAPVAVRQDKKVEPVTEEKSETPRTPAQPAAAAAAPSAPAKDRPTLEKILGKVEAHTQISNFILIGRGNDAEITSARILFIAVARSFGHTPEAIANKLKKPPVMIVDLTRTEAALTEKQKKAVEAIKGKL